MTPPNCPLRLLLAVCGAHKTGGQSGVRGVSPGDGSGWHYLISYTPSHRIQTALAKFMLWRFICMVLLFTVCMTDMD